MTTHVEAAIEKYFEGRIGDVKERDALFGHLDRCDGCRRKFDELAGVQRALSQVNGEIPAAELALIGRTVVSASAPKPQRAPWFIFARFAVPVLALGIAAVSLIRPDQFTAKGGGDPGNSGRVEALCFDPEGTQTKVLKVSGTCSAPGLVKLVYASARSVDHLSVHAGALKLEIDAPEPRSSLPGHLALSVGQQLEIVTTADGERTTMIITGVQR